MSEFLRKLNEYNSKIAEHMAEEEAKKPKPDEVRLQREQERRERWGQLRAREHSGSRPKRVANVFGFTSQGE